MSCVVARAFCRPRQIGSYNRSRKKSPSAAATCTSMTRPSSPSLPPTCPAVDPSGARMPVTTVAPPAARALHFRGVLLNRQRSGGQHRGAARSMHKAKVCFISKLTRMSEVGWLYLRERGAIGKVSATRDPEAVQHTVTEQCGSYYVACSPLVDRKIKNRCRRCQTNYVAVIPDTVENPRVVDVNSPDDSSTLEMKHIVPGRKVLNLRLHRTGRDPSADRRQCHMKSELRRGSCAGERSTLYLYRYTRHAEKILPELD